MQVFTNILLIFLIICAVAASLSRNLLNTILIFMSYSLVMSIIWILLESPDLAITEAAVGAGVTSVLFFVTLKKIHAIMKSDSGTEKESVREGGGKVFDSEDGGKESVSEDVNVQGKETERQCGGGNAEAGEEADGRRTDGEESWKGGKSL